jgi:hypothetical protein
MKHIAIALTEAFATLPWTNPVCFGVTCHKHANCAKYHAVDGAHPDQPRIDHCGPEFPHFAPLSTQQNRNHQELA